MQKWACDEICCTESIRIALNLIAMYKALGGGWEKC